MAQMALTCRIAPRFRPSDGNTFTIPTIRVNIRLLRFGGPSLQRGVLDLVLLGQVVQPTKQIPFSREHPFQ